MIPMMRLWSSLESSVALLEVTKEWQRRLGEEYQPLRRFLVATDCMSSWYPGRNNHQRYRVVACGLNDICGIDDDSGEQIELTRADVTCYRFNVKALASELAVALGATPQFTPVHEAPHTWRLGTLPVQLGARPIYLTLRADPRDLCTVVMAIGAHARQPYLLLQATSRWRSGHVDTALLATDGCMAGASELFCLQDAGRVVAAPDALQRLSMLLGVSPLAQPDGSIFKLEGEYRVVAFDGTRILLKESVGLSYICRLLGSPHREIPAAELVSERTGVHPATATGSAGEALDPQARAEYKRRLDELESDIEQATANNDVGWLERLQTERSQLIDTLRAATGLGGRSRAKNDVDRVRRSVSNAVARDIERIAEHHPALGRHLKGAISSGRVFRYAPERDIDWIL